MCGCVLAARTRPRFRQVPPAALFVRKSGKPDLRGGRSAKRRIQFHASANKCTQFAPLDASAWAGLTPARLSALHRGVLAWEHGSSRGRPRAALACARLPLRRSASSSHTGHSTRRAGFRGAPGARGYVRPRPQAPHPLHRLDVSRRRPSLSGMFWNIFLDWGGIRAAINESRQYH